MLQLPTQLGLSDADHEKLTEHLRAVALQGDALVRYWSADRGILWLGLHYGGHLATWLMVPAATTEAADRAAEFWREIVTEGIRLQSAAADSAVAAAMHPPH